MYQDMHKWDEGISVAEAKVGDGLWLLSIGSV